MTFCMNLNVHLPLMLQSKIRLMDLLELIAVYHHRNCWKYNLPRNSTKKELDLEGSSCNLKSGRQLTFTCGKPLSYVWCIISENLDSNLFSVNAIMTGVLSRWKQMQEFLASRHLEGHKC